MTSTDDTRALGSETLKAAADRYLARRVAAGELSGDSPRQIRTRVGRLVTLAGDRPASDVDRALIAEWQATLGALSPAARKGYQCAVAGSCCWLVAEGILEADPAAGMKRTREPRRTPRALPTEAVTRTIDRAENYKRPYLSVGVRDRLMVVLMVGCGLRSKEVAGLMLADWDRDRGLLFVAGKGGHARIVPVTEEVREAIDAYLELRDLEDGPLILAAGSKRLASQGISASWVSERVGRIMAAAGVHQHGEDGRSAHALRHTFATDVLAASGDLMALKELMGHASVATTQLYLAPAGEGRLRAAVEGRSYLRAVPVVPHVEASPVVPAPAAVLATGDRLTRIHCPTCCAQPDSDHLEDCAGWQIIEVATIRLWQANRDSWYEASCRSCGGLVDGPIGSEKAANYLDRGAVRSLRSSR